MCGGGNAWAELEVGCYEDGPDSGVERSRGRPEGSNPCNYSNLEFRFLGSTHGAGELPTAFQLRSVHAPLA